LIFFKSIKTIIGKKKTRYKEGVNEVILKNRYIEKVKRLETTINKNLLKFSKLLSLLKRR